MSRWFPALRLAACLGVVLAARAVTGPWEAAAEGPAAGERTPAVLAQQSFEAIKQGDSAKYAAIVLPEERAKFKAFVLGLFDREADADAKQVRGLLEGLPNREAAAKAGDAEVLAAFLSGSMKQVPDLKAVLARTRMEVLGQVAEGEDVVHLVTRVAMPKAQIVSCKRKDGAWHLMLSEEVNRLIDRLKPGSLFAEARKDPQRAAALLAAMRTDVAVLGVVNDGADAAQVVCRVTMQSGGAASEQLGAYPVVRGEPAWELLGQPDRRALAEALKKKWMPR